MRVRGSGDNAHTFICSTVFQPQCIRRSTRRIQVVGTQGSGERKCAREKMEKPATSITHKVQLMISFNFYDWANIQVSWFCSVAGIFFHLSASLTNTLDSNRLPLSLYDSLSPAIQFVLLFLLTFSFPFTDFHWLLVIICMQLLKNSI